MKQVDKQIKDIQIQANRGTNVVGFAAVDDAAGIKQNEACHDHYHHRRERQRQRGDCEEHVRDHRHDGNDQACHQETTQIRKVLLRIEGVGRQGEKHQCRAGQCLQHHSGSVFHGQIKRQHRPDRGAPYAGKGEDSGQALGAVRHLMNNEKQHEAHKYQHQRK